LNFFQPSFKLKEKRRQGAKVIKRYHMPLVLRRTDLGEQQTGSRQ